ncbi:hypothetical protein B0H10DRAFT_1080977 [Mycena sp. CBHHK59/15]|nr:hypothetical protein B0H10DRAFT_1080977 [Mycena sp. CBHHK59/15]
MSASADVWVLQSGLARGSLFLLLEFGFSTNCHLPTAFEVAVHARSFALQASSTPLCERCQPSNDSTRLLDPPASVSALIWHDRHLCRLLHIAHHPAPQSRRACATRQVASHCPARHIPKKPRAPPPRTAAPTESKRRRSLTCARLHAARRPPFLRTPQPARLCAQDTRVSRTRVSRSTSTPARANNTYSSSRGGVTDVGLAGFSGRGRCGRRYESADGTCAAQRGGAMWVQVAGCVRRWVVASRFARSLSSDSTTRGRQRGYYASPSRQRTRCQIAARCSAGRPGGAVPTQARATSDESRRLGELEASPGCRLDASAART